MKLLPFGADNCVLTIKIILLAAFSCYSACAADKLAMENLYGRWKVTAVDDASPIVEIGGNAASNLVGKSLVIAPKGIRFANRSCDANYDAAVDVMAVLQAYRLPEPQSLHLPQNSLSFDGGCTDLFTKGAGQIVFTWRGYFLLAKRVQPSKESKGSRH